MDLPDDVPWLERLEHPRANSRELRRRRAHDHRDDVAAVRGLRLEQAARLRDVDADAVAGHSELELAGGARPVVAAAAGRGDEQHVRPVPLEHAEGGRQSSRVVVGERSSSTT